MPITIKVPAREFYDRDKGVFINFNGGELTLEHSLLSVSKWEGKYEKPYLSSEKTEEEVLDYVRFMTLTKHVDPLIYYCLTEENIDDIANYINKKHHANVFSSKEESKSKEYITATTIYYQMFAQGIDKECERWHLNQLMALIKMCSIKNAPPKKMSKQDVYKRQAGINKANRKRFRSKG